MSTVVRAQNLTKRYGSSRALDGASFEIRQGAIVGLIGPNGAGKTTALKAILGLTPYEGELEVLGLDPLRQRPELMREVSFIADTAVLPRWIRVDQLLDYTENTHPGFNRMRCEELLTRTEIKSKARVRTLSKGMVVQLHLSIVMAINARFLVLDEPTLGLDILFRTEFYRTLIEEYFDEQKTILVTTHQVEEVENLLTDVLFMDHGRIVLSESLHAIGERYLVVAAPRDNAARLQSMRPMHQSSAFGRDVFLFSDRRREEFEGLGDVSTPNVADLFVATIKAQNDGREAA